MRIPLRVGQTYFVNLPEPIPVRIREVLRGRRVTLTGSGNNYAVWSAQSLHKTKYAAYAQLCQYKQRRIAILRGELSRLRKLMRREPKP